jgi:hypothetical protein
MTYIHRSHPLTTAPSMIIETDDLIHQHSLNSLNEIKFIQWFILSINSLNRIWLSLLDSIDMTTNPISAHTLLVIVAMVNPSITRITSFSLESSSSSSSAERVAYGRLLSLHHDPRHGTEQSAHHSVPLPSLYVHHHHMNEILNLFLASSPQCEQTP